MASISGIISAAKEGLSSLFAFEDSVSVETLQGNANQRVSSFRDAMKDVVYIGHDHKPITGADVLKRADDLGVAMGIDTSIREIEYSPAGPLGMHGTPTPEARSIGVHADGVKNNVTPYIRVPSVIDEDVLKMSIASIDENLRYIEGFRNDPSTLQKKVDQFAESRLRMIRENDENSYREIVLNGAQLDLDSTVVIAEGYEGKPYTDDNGQLITVSAAVDNILGRTSVGATELTAEA